jgi:uncharacterized protein (TIGR03437 family)
LELSDASAAIVKRGKAFKSRTAPEIEHAPFVTMDTQGHLVVAVSLLAVPGRYVIPFEFDTAGDGTRAATISVSVAGPKPLAINSGTPVVLLNGYQPFSLFQLSTCPTSPADGSDPFGTLSSALTQGYVFFDNCKECPNWSIEQCGSVLGQVINSVQYSDGTVPQQVDVVAHSMGGLIVRSYLSGKQTTVGLFSPPLTTKIRKAVFIGTPHFGSFAAGLLNLGTQAIQMNPGSQFLWDLNRWNQGYDNLREVDALAIAGNGFSGGQNDGVVSVTSATIAFAGFPDLRTRIINGGCHVSALPGCTANGIADSQLSGQIVQAFLSGSNAWMNMGNTSAQFQATKANGGRYVSFVSANNVPQTNVAGMAFGGNALTQNPDTNTTFYNDFLPASTGTLTFTAQGQGLQSTITVPAGGYGTTVIKYPPLMTYARPAAAQINTLNVAPGSLISIFGTGLASSTAIASFPWPTHLADVTLTANGQALQLLYVGSAQINAYFPTNLSGLVTLQLTNSLGQHSLNVMTTNASPAIFSADSSGTGIAAAIHAATGQPVTTSNPATAGEYIEIYGTGFGSTYQSGGIAVTTLTPALSIGTTTASVTFCGMPQGSVGLYQINFVVPGGLPSATSVPLSIAMGNYASNVVTLPVR